MSGGVVCRNEYKLPSSSGQLSGGRIAAEDVLTAAASDCPPEAKVDLAVAMEHYLSQMICQTTNLYIGSSEKASRFLADLEADILANPDFQNYHVTFPTDKAPIIAALVAGDCTTAGQLLAAANTTQAPVGFGEFNAVKNATYDAIQKDIMKKQFLPIYANINAEFNYQKLGTVTLYEMTDEKDIDDEVGTLTLNMYSTDDAAIAAEAPECLYTPPTITPQEIAAMYYADTYIDMSPCPKNYKGTTSYTSPTQVPRNSRYYFDKLLEKQLNGQISPMLSNVAIGEINKGNPPIIDDQWIQYNPKHAPYKGQILVHHHLNRTNIAVALPTRFHQIHHNVLHYGESVLKNVAQYCKTQNIPIDKKKLFRRSVKGFSIVLSFLDILSWVNGDPQSIYSLYEPVRKGKLFYKPEQDVYILVSEVFQDNTIIRVKYSAFSDYGYDDNLKKYIGVNLLGMYTETYNRTTKITTFGFE